MAHRSRLTIGTRLTRRLIIILTAVAGACARPTVPVVPSFDLPSQIRVGTPTGVVSVPLEDYVLATALAEIGPAGESEDTIARVFEVQSIITRTYAAGHLGRHAREGFDVCDATHCQVYSPVLAKTSRFAATARGAVARTRALVLLYSGRIAETLFHADCGGHTADAGAVWGGPPLPYLLGGADDVPVGTHMSWELVVPAARLAEVLRLDARSNIGRRLEGLKVETRDGSGRAALMRLTGERTVDLRGEDFRAVINRALGDRAIRSTLFSVSKDVQTYRFLGTGFGHGVGLCQVGATARARRGESVSEILGTYYPGARLSRAP